MVGAPTTSELSGIYDVLKSRDYGVLEPLDGVGFVVIMSDTKNWLNKENPIDFLSYSYNS